MKKLALLSCFACCWSCATYSPTADTNGGAGGTGQAATGASAAAAMTAGATQSGAGGVVEMGGTTSSAGGDVVQGGGGSGSIADRAAGGGAASAGGAAFGGAAGTAMTGGAGGGPADVSNALEVVAVPVDGSSVASHASLDAGELFLLKATGSIDAGGVSIDAEYGGFTASAPGQDSIAAADVGVDTGFNVERAPKDVTPGRKKWFGDYRADHAYYLTVTGKGAPLSLKLLRPAGTSGSGSLRVSIVRLSPSAPALEPALETVMANVSKPTVHSTFTTLLGTTYLLQASGEGKVGGANLALGDADWMDYDVNGGGKVDIGDGNVDYGLGVDESDPKVTPRARWWGPWRKDHTYFMLFAGTGNTVAFSYYDVGDYGDNSTTSKIAVKILPLP